MSKRTARKFDMERFSLKKSNRFAAVESLDDSGPINRVWEAIRGNVKVSAKESRSVRKKCRKPSVIEEGSKFVD